MKRINMKFTQSVRAILLISFFGLSLAVGSFLSFKPVNAETLISSYIDISPGSICEGDSASLTWNSTGATSVTISPFGSVSTHGVRTVSPSSTTTYTLTATNNDGGYGTGSATLYVDDCTGGDDDVTVTLTADDTSIDEGDNTTLRWTSQNATSCTASGGRNGWAGSRGTSGSFNTDDLNSDTSYSITCQNSSSSDSDSVTIRVDEDNRDDDEAPDVTTRSATDVTLTSATLNGRVDGNGCSTHAWFEWSEDRDDVDSDEETDEQSTGSGSRSFDERITGLRANTTYYFRAVAENCEDDDTGSIMSFRTDGFSYNTPYFTPYSTPSSYSYQTPAAPSGSAFLLVTSSVDRHQPIVPSLDNTCPLPGDEIGYTLRYQNVGNRGVTNSVLQLNLPPEVDYLYSDPNNPSVFGNTLIFNLGTISAGEEGTVMIRVRVRENAPAGALLNFPAVLSYIDPSGQPQSVSVNVSAEVECTRGEAILNLGANVFGAGFFPATVLGWLFLILLILLLAYLARQILRPIPPATVVVDRHNDIHTGPTPHL